MEGTGDAVLPQGWDLDEGGELAGLDTLLDEAISAGQLDVLGAGLPLDQLQLPLPLPLAAQGSGSASTGPLASSGSDPQRQPSTSDEQERQERIRAQNREKQQRFRQRQRAKKKEMEEQFEAVSADLERERAALESLRLSTAVMEGMKVQKEAAVEALQAASQAERGNGGGAGSVAAARPAAAAAAGAGALALRLSAMPFGQRVELCCRLFLQSPARELVERHGILEEGQQLVDGFSLDMELQQELGDQVVAAHPQMLDAVLAMTEEAVKKDWGEFIDFAAVVVEDLDAGRIGEAEAVQRMRPAVLYNVVLDAILLRHRPDVIRPLMYRTRLPDESEQDATARWARAGEAMAVSFEQAQQLVAPYQEYQARMAELRSQTRASFDTLRRVQQALSEKLLHLDGGLRPEVAQYLDLADAAGQLSGVRDAELYCLLDFYTSAGAVISELQKARIIAACRPALNPDVPTIVRLTLIRHGLLKEDAPLPQLDGPAQLPAPPPA